MSEKRISVPEGMLKAAVSAAWKHIGFSSPHASSRVAGEIEESFLVSLEAALRWLSENPIVPNELQFSRLYDESDLKDGRLTYHAVIEWQLRMFDAPEPEVPEEIKDLLVDLDSETTTGERRDRNVSVIEAYRRGKASR